MKRAARHSRLPLLPLLLSALLLAASPAAVFAQKPQEADKQAQKGAEYLNKGDWRRAADSYQKALRANPAHVEATFGLGVAQMQLKQFDAALASFSAVLKLPPNTRTIDAQRNSALVLFDLRRFKESAESFQRAAQGGELQPNFQYYYGKALLNLDRIADAVAPLRAATRADQRFQADANYSLGYALMRLNRAQEAAEPLQQAVRLAPANAAYLSLLGAYYLSAGRDAEAESTLRRSATIDASLTDTFVWLGIALNRLSRYQEAVTSFQAVLRTRPDHPDALLGLGFAKIGLSQYRDALPLFEQVMKLKPTDAYPLIGMCAVYYGQGQYAAMLSTAQQAARLAPDNADARVNLAGAYAIPGQMKEAEAEARQAAKLAPESFLPHLALGFILVRLDRGQDALAEAREAVRLKPDSIEAQNLLAYVMNQVGQHQDALAVGLTALGLRRRPEDEGWAHYNIATSYKATGQRDKAMESYRSSLASYQQVGRTLDPDELYLMGTAYLQLDQDEQAVAALRQSIKIRPNFAQSRYNLGLAYVASGDRKGATEEYNALRRIDPARASKLQSLIGGGSKPGRK